MSRAQKKEVVAPWPSAQEQRAMMRILAERPDLMDEVARLQGTSPDPFVVARTIRVENWRWTSFLHRPENAELLKRYEWADKAYARELVHKSIEVADDCDEETGVAKARLQGDRYLQAAGFFDADKFGKKVEVRHSGTVSVDAGLVGRIGDLLSARRGRVIDVTPENGDVEQPEARRVHFPEVGGSSPSVATISDVRAVAPPQAQSADEPARDATGIPLGSSGLGASDFPSPDTERITDIITRESLRIAAELTDSAAPQSVLDPGDPPSHEAERTAAAALFSDVA